MFMVFKKKQMLIATLVIMLGVAGYLNYKYDDSAETKDVLSVKDMESEPSVGDTAMVNALSSEKKDDDTFASYRLEREKTRAKVKEELESSVANKNLSDEARKNAEQRLSELTTASQLETSAEAILKSKGFDDVVVFINGDSVNVTVKSDGLSTTDTAKIIDTVYELTKNNNIKIVEVE